MPVLTLRRTTRPNRGPRRGRLLTLLVAPVLAVPLMVGAVPLGQAEPALAQATPQLGAPVTVTLITGDRVVVAPDGGATIEPAPGREDVTFLRDDGGDRLSVLPSDVAQLVVQGRLDPRLFDVSYLIREGFQDGERKSLPLLLTGGTAGAAAGVAGVTRQLPQTGTSAVTWDKASAPEQWARLASSGVDKIWLDANLRVALDQSVPQVGAPQAWQAGYDGTGTTVAVLDTGIDADHPDLAGRVVGAANFSNEPTTADGSGHGTHVASTIAGTGAASGGVYKGVAPGARLLNVKVCNSAGTCPTSWVLAGMAWAAANGADVVNLSLGGDQTDGTDPLSTAVNALTAADDVLFVIAAGNRGPNAGTVSSPGAADAALTVAAVDKSDHLASFSSRGPRVGDRAVKPDLAAPGVAIAAARAAGTAFGAPVDDRYTRASGTSMATPHVAGAAAILAGQHPDWTAGHLKAALMGSASAVDAGAFQVGTGRLDVGRAVTSKVDAVAASVSFGLQKWPHDASTARSVTYRNAGAAPVTLDLAASATDEKGEPAPAGLFTVSATKVTVPANGTASVDLALSPREVPAGSYGGRLTATGPDGTVVRTAFGTELETESYDLTVDLVDRNGKSPDPSLSPTLFNVFDYATGRVYSPLASGHTLRLPPGDYAVQGYVTTAGPGEPDTAQLAYPEVRLAGDTRLTLDARQANKVTVGVDSASARARTLTSSMAMKLPPGNTSTHYVFTLDMVSPSSPIRRDLYVGTVGSAGSADRFFHAIATQLEEPLIRLDVDGARGFPVDVFYAENIENPRTPLPGVHRVDVVHGGAGTPAELAAVDVAGKLVVLSIPRERDAEVLARVDDVKRAGGLAVLLDRPLAQAPRFAAGAVPGLPTLLAADPQRAQLVELAKTGGASVTIQGVKASPYQYNLFLPTVGQAPSDTAYRVPDRDLGKIDVEYQATGVGRYTDRQVWFLGRNVVTGRAIHLRTPDPLRRLEYYSAGPALWQRHTADYAGPERWTERAAILPGQPLRETQFGGVMGPSFDTRPFSWSSNITLPVRPAWAYRQGDTLDVRVPMLADSQPGHITTPFLPGYTRLYRDGSLVRKSASSAGSVATVPAGTADYRLEMGLSAVADPTASWTVSTGVNAAWTFRSGTTAAATALPLMAVRFEPMLDEYNRAPGGRWFEFPIRVEHQPGSTTAQVTELTVQASDDDGATWRPVDVHRAADQWVALVRNPAQGFVTLRATAIDADGNTAQLTIFRAYGAS